jgi:1,4-alpha-glucan branching enzyme
MTTASKKKPKVSQSLKQTEFSFLAPEAQGVYIGGSFNQWNPSSHPLKRDKKGIWKISLPLSPGQYEYRFFVDGEWQTDPNCPTCVENPFGTLNCVRIVE